MKTIEWGFLIINYLFLGGLSAGLFFVAALATLLERNGDRTYARIARYGALLAPWPVMLGCFLLIFDLGKWYRFYKLFLHLRWVSPMSIGSWLLLVFSGMALLLFVASLTREERQRLFRKLPAGGALLRIFSGDLSAWQRPLAALGLPFSVAVGIYTGVLLGAVQSRPFWNTNLVAQMFLFSALSTGCAALILVLAFGRRKIEAAEFRLLYTLDICFLTLEFFIVLPYLIHGQLSVEAVRESLQLILGGPFTLVFWVFFLGLGLLAPLAIEVREMAPALFSKTIVHNSRTLAALTAVLVLAGGFLLRYIFVFAGQMSAFK
jgi:formate-dependent nitrite reductase membrane component NrfD